MGKNNDRRKQQHGHMAEKIGSPPELLDFLAQITRLSSPRIIVFDPSERHFYTIGPELLPRMTRIFRS